MKQTNILLLILALVISFFGCGKDDDDFSLEGSWLQESSELVIDFGVQDVQNITIVDNDPVNVLFRQDGTGTFTDAEGTSSFTWELNGRMLTISDSETTLNLTLTTMTENRVIGEQALSPLEMRVLFDFDESQLELFEAFPNLEGRITISLRRNN